MLIECVVAKEMMLEGKGKYGERNIGFVDRLLEDGNNTFAGQLVDEGILHQMAIIIPVDKGGI